MGCWSKKWKRNEFKGWTAKTIFEREPKKNP